MSATIVIAPVRKTARVNAPIARAFDVFTSGLSRWWPHDHSVGKKPVQKVLIEPRLGGRWLEISQDGTETIVTTIILWEPPRRVVMVWQVNAQWKPDTTMKSEVDASPPTGRTPHSSNSCTTSSKRWVRRPALRCGMMSIVAGRASSSAMRKKPNAGASPVRAAESGNNNPE